MTPGIRITALIFMTSLLMWQDWKERQVNIYIVLIAIVALSFKLSHPLHSLGGFCLLELYRFFRKGSIQPIDNILFSVGAGCFSLSLLPFYYILTAVALVGISKVTSEQKLPFLTAWAVGFWGTFFVENYSICELLS